MKYAAYDYRKVCAEAANAVPRETRQRFLDLVWDGKTIGDARELAGLTFDAAMGVLNLNIADLRFLRRQSM